MPRVANAPRLRQITGNEQTPAKPSPMKIPLNDDKREKANRLLSRQAQHEAQMSQIRNAATPLRKRRSMGMAGPQTPGQDEDAEMFDVGGTAVTPMKRVPILANFEEWMKMATDNKINATNSWNFALIDYFHDMSLLKEGDGVNFQRASVTLDGCVKIYTNRVDSVATETGKLLSGLADSKERKGKDDAGEGEDAEDGDDGEDGEEGPKKRKKKMQRTAEATLVSSFAQIQLKKMELEFSVDPLFKKASADFDEGGAKGLLLNHLSIDERGRIVFDSSDDTNETAEEATPAQQEEATAGAEMDDEDAMDIDRPSTDIDISILARKYFPDLMRLDELDVCPSLKNHALGDASGSSELPFIQAPEDWKQERRNNSPEKKSSDDAPIYDNDDDDGGLAGLDMDDAVGFGEGGEAWAREAALEPQLRVHNIATMNASGDDDNDSPQDGAIGNFDPEKPAYGVTMRHANDNEQENILDYFDKALQKNWAGPEHWKIRRVKDAAKANSAGPTKRKEKEPFEIDFLAPLSQAQAEALYTPASSASVISLPKAQWRSKTRNLLPDDKHFNSRQLLRLFLKPKAMLGSRTSGSNGSRKVQQTIEVPEGEVDEAYWARNEQQQANAVSADEAPQGNYDANFFEDDGMGMPGGMDDDEAEGFADARDHFSPPAEGLGEGIEALPSSQPEGAFGTQLVTQSRRLRPEYVQYARVAKKVDVRRLKEEIWRKMDFDEPSSPDTSASDHNDPPTPKDLNKSNEELKFTKVMGDLQSIYPKQAMADISTSFCFICLLHLANEKGLVIENQENFTELKIRKDHTAEIAGLGE